MEPPPFADRAFSCEKPESSLPEMLCDIRVIAAATARSLAGRQCPRSDARTRIGSRTLFVKKTSATI